MALTVPPHIKSSVTITNSTGSILPVSAGVRLSAGQTKTFFVSQVQLQEELVPRLEKLRLAGKCTYKLTPGTPYDIGSAGGAAVAGPGQLGSLPLTSIPSALALAQSVWYINPTTGDDNNTGLSAGTALRTAAEYLRRTGLFRPISNAVDIFIDADLPATDPLIVTGVVMKTGAYIWVHGSSLTVVRTGTITTYTAPVAATNQLTVVNDAGVSSWTADAGKLLRMTSGPRSGNGSSWIVKDLGSNNARMTNFAYRSNPLNVASFAPSNGDTYEVLNMRVLGGGLIANVVSNVQPSLSDAGLRIDYCEVPAAFSAGITGLNVQGGSAYYFCCNLKGVLDCNSLHSFMLCQFGSVASFGQCALQGGFFNSTFMVMLGQTVSFGNSVTPMFHGGSFNTGDFGGRVVLRAGAQMSDVTNYWNLQSGTILKTASDIYGTTATGTMFIVGAGAKIITSAITNLRVGGSVNDITVAGKTAIFPIDGATGLATSPAQTCTLGNFANAAIFNGNINDPLTGGAVVTGN